MKKAIIASLLAWGSIAAYAQIPLPDPDTTTKHFLIVASIKNLQEISASEQAVQKTKNMDVRTFAQIMIKDHTQAEQQLLTLAKRLHISLSPTATGGIKTDPLLAGSPDFDSVYVHAMSAGNGNTVQVFENYAITGKNPAVRTWAQQTLPTLRKHWEHIKNMEKTIK